MSILRRMRKMGLECQKSIWRILLKTNDLCDNLNVGNEALPISY